MSESWREQARCRDQHTDLFFPDDPDPDPMATTGVIRKFCRQCPVRKECLLFALAQPAEDDFGIWGGTTEQERKTIRKILDEKAR